MLLIVTNKKDYTADFLILELRKQDVSFVRLNTEDFPSQISLTLPIDETGLQNAYFKIYGQILPLSEINSVWYRRPLDSLPSPDIQEDIAHDFIKVESRHTLHSIWQLLSDRLWVNHPNKLRIAELKPYQLVLAQQIGLSIPPTLITTHKGDARSFVQNHQEQVVYKPMRYGYVVRDHESDVGLIYTNKLNHKHIEQLETVQYAPSLFQKYIPKRVELRVTVIGDVIFAVELDSQRHETGLHDWRKAKLAELPHKVTQLPNNIEEKCFELVNKLGLHFGAIDLIQTPDGDFVFLEINPNGQWAWLEQMLPELEMREAFIKLFTRE